MFVAFRLFHQHFQIPASFIISSRMCFQFKFWDFDNLDKSYARYCKYDHTPNVCHGVSEDGPSCYAIVWDIDMVLDSWESLNLWLKCFCYIYSPTALTHRNLLLGSGVRAVLFQKLGVGLCILLPCRILQSYGSGHRCLHRSWNDLDMFSWVSLERFSGINANAFVWGIKTWSGRNRKFMLLDIIC